MSADVKLPFLGCDEGQAECAIPHVPQMVLVAEEPLPTPSGPAFAPRPTAAEAALAHVGLPSDGGPGTGLASSAVQSRNPVTTPRGSQVPGQARWVGPAGPERPVMEILFTCLEGGRRYYSVRLNGQEIFVGTRPECDRFLSLHDQKVAQEQVEARRVPRARPFPIRSYRAAHA